jgi:TolB-like protein
MTNFVREAILISLRYRWLAMDNAADPSLPTPRTLVVNGVAIDLENETLFQPKGGTIELRPQAFAVLRYLIAHPNRILSKSELIDAVWNGAAVTDDSLVQCIHEIRRALGDHQHTILQTASRRGYRLVLPQEPQPASPGTPSLAVLPFRQLDGLSPGDFADGLTADLTASLSKIRGLLVVACRSRATSDPRDVAVQLGVRYLLDGSVRKSGHQLRITVDIVDGSTGGHVWADMFNGADDEIFDLQDRLVEQIVGVVEPSIRRAEIERARRKRPASLDAYELYLRAIPHVLANTKDDGEKAIKLLNGALAIDPEFLPAHAYAAWCCEQLYLRNGLNPADRAAALRHADFALGVNSDDPQAIGIAGFVRANLTGDYDSALEVLDRALALNGKSPLTLGFSALVSAHGEHVARAIEHAMRALRLSPPDDPLNYHPYCALTVANLFAGDFAEAAKHAQSAIRANPAFSIAHAYLVTSLVRLGKLDAARQAAGRLLEVAPTFTVDGFGLGRATQMKMIADALRMVELP